MEQPLEFSIEEGLLGAAAGDGPPATDLLRKQLKICASIALSTNSNVIARCTVVQLASQKCLEIQDELAYPGDQGDLDGYLERFSTCEDKAEQLERCVLHHKCLLVLTQEYIGSLKAFRRLARLISPLIKMR